MEHIRLPEDIRRLFLCWLNEVHYHLGHKGHATTIPVTRGIRQGCVATPFLWLMWTVQFLTTLEQTLGPTWVREHLISMYADDIISQWDLYTIEDLIAARQEIGQLLDLLENMKLAVSLKKSVVLVRLVGTARNSIYKKYTRKHEGQVCLIIPRANGTTSLLPIVKQHRYLGTILSYSNAEDKTLAYRLDCGRQAFFRLIKFLGKTHVISVRLKLRLWTQCVQRSYFYGLFAVGLTQQGYTRLARRIFLDLRRITQTWSHLTHVTNSDLCKKCHLHHPIDELQVRWHHQATRECNERPNLGDDDFLHKIDIHEHWIALHTQIAEWYHHQQTSTSLTEEEEWNCPHCSKSFAHRTIMRRRIAQQHADCEPKQTFEPLRDSLNGLPQCRHCRVKLSSQHMLQQHIERKHCRAFDPDAEAQRPVSQQEDVLDKVRENDWPALLSRVDLCNSLRHHCVLCNHWCAQTNGLSVHIKKMHRDITDPSCRHQPTCQTGES